MTADEAQRLRNLAAGLRQVGTDLSDGIVRAQTLLNLAATLLDGIDRIVAAPLPETEADR